MRVFVLSPGRSGSLTFAEACKHITNFTAGHETRSWLVERRFDYPDRHIEVDNRLTWMLGGLAANANPGDRYVWLRRDPELVVDSFLNRWATTTYRAHIMEAFGHGIIQRGADWEDREPVVRFYVETVEANIAEFVKSRVHMTVWLGSPDDFEDFWKWMGAEGDLAAGLETWATPHN